MNAKKWRGIYYKWSNKIMGRRSKREKRARERQAKQLQLVKENTNFDKLNKAISDTNPVKAVEAKATTKMTATEWLKEKDYGIHWHHKSCSHKPTLVCSIGGINVHAATRDSITYNNAEHIQLIINCTMMPTKLNKPESLERLVIGDEKKFASLRSHVIQPREIEELRLDWTDGGIWPSGISFWRELFDICKANNYTDIVFCCLGGHGRTGTALVSFLIANSAYEPVMSLNYTSELNKRYCFQAVETKAQEQYLDCLETENGRTEAVRENVVTWIAPVQKQSNSAATGTAKIELKQDGPAIGQTPNGAYCCMACGHLEEFCSCGRCPACEHFSDLCECTLSEKYQARKLLKDVQKLQESKTIAEVSELTDGEAQELANKAIIAEVTKEALKDYQWK